MPGARPVRDLFIPRIDEFILSEEDVAESPDAWREAPVLVSTNALRLGIIHARRRDIAMRLGVPIVIWRVPLPDSVASAVGPMRLEEIYENEPQLWGCYIQGSGCYLDKNVNVKLGIVNGGPVCFERLELGSPDSDANDAAIEAADRARIVAGAAGDVIEIQFPYAIQVEALDIPIASVGSYSLHKKRTVVRIFAKTAREVSVYIPGLGQRKIKVMVHGIDPKFAATLYKAEGRTMERALAVFNKLANGGITFEEFLVWLSRTTFQEHAKIFPLLPGETWDHLASLHPSDNVVIYMAGFEKGGVFNVEGARVAAAALAALLPPTPAERKAAKAVVKAAAAQAKQAAADAKRAQSTASYAKRKRADAELPSVIHVAFSAGQKRSRNAVTLTPGAASAARAASTMVAASSVTGASSDPPTDSKRPHLTAHPPVLNDFTIATAAHASMPMQLVTRKRARRDALSLSIVGVTEATAAYASMLMHAGMPMRPFMAVGLSRSAAAAGLTAAAQAAPAAAGADARAYTLETFFTPLGLASSDTELMAFSLSEDAAGAAGIGARFVARWHECTLVLRDDLRGLRNSYVSGRVLAFATDALQAANDRATASLRLATKSVLSPRGAPTRPSRVWIYSPLRPPPTKRTGPGFADRRYPCWHRHHFIDVTLFDLLIFVCHVDLSHFTVMVLDLAGRRLHYYDSIRKFALLERGSYCAEAKVWLQTISLLRGTTQYSDAATWETIFHDDGIDVPLQGYELDAGAGFTVGNDCAGFAVGIVACLAHGIPIAFSQRDMPNRRRQFLSNILHSGSLADTDAAGKHRHTGKAVY